MSDLFRTPIVRWALLITVVLQLSQQFCGINAVIYYSVIIFKKAGYNQTTAEYVNLGIGAANIIVTIISTALMDRLGRRVLHLTGLGGTFVTITILTISLLVKSTPAWNLVSLIMTIAYVAVFAIGPGSIPWLITAELFNQAYRVPASSIAVLVNWSANFVVGLCFKPLFTVNLETF
jgi:SP family facilitated glucose transporter-like MFS transporter 1